MSYSIARHGTYLTLDFITSDPATGGLMDADSAPTAEVFEDSSATPTIATPTVAQRGALTGHYYVLLLLSTAQGFSPTGTYNVVVTATVNGITSKAVLASLTLMPAIPMGETAGTPTASSFVTDRTESDDNFWKDTLVLFITGNCAGQVKQVDAYNGTTKAITVKGEFSPAPAGGDIFYLLNQ